MNNLNKLMLDVLDTSNNSIEIVATAQNQVKYITSGVIYSSFDKMSMTAQFAVIKSLMKYRVVYDSLSRKYGPDEAISRMCWCLYGAFDVNVDINASGAATKEISTHCSKCQYAKPFCNRILEPLTCREQECFSLLSLGKTDKEIASYMSISYNTVIKHFTNAIEKFRIITGENVTRTYVLTKIHEAGLL